VPEQATVREANAVILRQVNEQITLAATRFANALLSGVFRAIFRIEKAYEAAEPEVFQLEHDPDRILWHRLDPHQMRNLAVSIANEELSCNRYQLFSEYDFVVLADASRSMMLNWWYVYGFSDPSLLEVTADDSRLRLSKLWCLKYVLAAFLAAAERNGFKSFVTLFGAGRTEEYTSASDPDLKRTILERADAVCYDLAETRAPEQPLMLEVMRQLVLRKRRCIILCISDFDDFVRHLSLGFGGRCHLERAPRLGASELSSLVGELAERHKCLILKVNDREELPEDLGVLAPAGTRLGHCDRPWFNVEASPVPKRTFVTPREPRISDRHLRMFHGETRRAHEGVRSSLTALGARWGEMVIGRDSLDDVIYQLGTTREW
jgi:hypothetical protein